MHPAFYEQTARIQADHWWFRHRRGLAADWLGAALDGGRVELALDVGCGPGGNLAWLGGHAQRVVGLDLSEQALALAAERCPAAALVRGDAAALSSTFAGGRFGLVTLFNVLYHRWVEDDAAVLAAAAELLEPGGRLLVCEPAFRLLWRRHDVLDYGARRYRRSELEAVTHAAGLEVERSSYFNALSLPPALLLALADRLTGAATRPPSEGEGAGELGLPPAWLNRLLLGLLGAERAVIRAAGSLPAGVGLMLLARRGGGVKSLLCTNGALEGLEERRVPPDSLVQSRDLTPPATPTLARRAEGSYPAG